MFLHFFDPPNETVVDQAIKIFDSHHLQSLLRTLPTAMVAMLENQPEIISEDPDLDEPRRQHLNSVISLSSLLLDVTSIYTNPNVRMLSYTRDDVEALERAAEALRLLQTVKDERIAKIHEIMGDNFGSATAFQTHSYNDDADHIMAYIRGETPIKGE